MTIMTVGSGLGTRRCTARCYNAHGSKCTCCGGGANHGKGLKGALKAQEERFLDEGSRRALAEIRSQLELEFAR